MERPDDLQKETILQAESSHAVDKQAGERQILIGDMVKTALDLPAGFEPDEFGYKVSLPPKSSKEESVRRGTDFGV